MEINISPIVFAAMDIIKNSFGGVDANFLSQHMYRIEPDKFTPLGKLGVDITVDGIKTFLSCQLAEDIACTPHGQAVADSFVFSILKDAKEKS